MRHRTLFDFGTTLAAMGIGAMAGAPQHVAVGAVVAGVMVTIVPAKPETVPFVVGGREVTRLRVVDTTIRDEARR